MNISFSIRSNFEFWNPSFCSDTANTIITYAIQRFYDMIYNYLTPLFQISSKWPGTGTSLQICFLAIIKYQQLNNIPGIGEINLILQWKFLQCWLIISQSFQNGLFVESYPLNCLFISYQKIIFVILIFIIFIPACICSLIICLYKLFFMF